MEYEQRVYAIKVLVILLLLGLPPLTMWSGKFVGALRGWRLVSFPLILYCIIYYIAAASDTTHLALTEVYGWEEILAGAVQDTIVWVGSCLFLYGVLTSVTTPPKNA